MLRRTALFSFDAFSTESAMGGKCIMRLAETDGKSLLRRHGVAVPRGVLLRTGETPPAEAALWPGHILKA
jgi:hypothetical protein